MSETLVLCYNKGCGQKFDPLKNSEDLCQFHPGVPVFHDALKGWSCCNKKSTDFSTFLSYQGCARGSHSNIKPPEADKPLKDQSQLEEVIAVEAPKPREPMPRPSADEEMVALTSTVAPSLQNVIANLKAKPETKTDDSVPTEVPLGTLCKNSGCQAKFEGDQSEREKCLYHPGEPIFHEGMKFWSCCEKKTSDFDNFLSQAGCTEAKHTWFKKQDNDKVANCRFDFFQTGGYAILTVFSKNPMPDECTIKANQVALSVNISFEGGSKVFAKDFVLHGIIDVKATQVNYYQSKVEIKMKKAEPVSWKKLES